MPRRDRKKSREVKYLHIYDPETGEWLFAAQRTDAVARKQANASFVLVDQAVMFSVLSDPNIRNFDARLLNYFISVLEYQNEIRVSQAEAAAELEVSPAQVSRAIKRLISCEVLERDGRILRLSPFIAWRGNKADRRTALTQWHEAYIKERRHLHAVPDVADGTT